MTEDEWLACQVPEVLLELEPYATSDRKLRLVACAVARRILASGGPRVHPDLNRAIELAEQMADGAPGEALRRAGDDLVVLREDAYEAAFGSVNDTVLSHEQGLLAGLVRCVTGNPFRKVFVASSWRSAVVRELATAAYERRLGLRAELDPARLAVLSDALEEAGCTDADILSHLRSPGPHARGCWALDLVLGNE